MFTHLGDAMRYGLDVDGILADIVEVFKAEVNKVWPGRAASGYQPNTWDFRDLLTEAEVEQVWNRLHNKPNLWLEPRPHYDNVRAVAIHRVRHPEDEIFYVTARHESKGMPAMHQTQTWLQECGIGGLGTSVIVSHGGDKSDIFNALGCDANIDDRLEAVIKHATNTKGAFLLDRPWNRDGRPPGLATVSSLEEFFRRANGKTSK